MRYGYIVGGGLLSIALFYLIMMVAGSLGAGEGIIELLALLLAMALPGVVVGAAVAEREAREKEISELKEELTAIRALLEKQDRQ